MSAIDDATAQQGDWWRRRLEELRADADRWPLWLPVAMGCGIAGYFLLREEPAGWLGTAVLALLLAAAWALRRQELLRNLLLAGACAALGFAAVQTSAWLADAPKVEARMPVTTVTGRILQVSPREAGFRVLITPERIEGWRGPLPQRLRITVAARFGALPGGPGQRLAVRAVLLPLPPPAMPGAFDFPRHAYFDRLGGLGYATVAPELAPGGPPGGGSDWLEQLREGMSARIRTAIGGAAGAVAAALVTGERGAIPEAVNAAWRDTGLAHLLSISGLHISLVAGIVFLAVRSLLATIPGLALRQPIKKWAVAVAVPAAFFYMLLSGAEVPTQRAFLMAAIVFLAILVDREAISLRLVAWAAAAILLFLPEALIGASFQMSFAAVLALVAAYEAGRERIRSLRAGAGPIGKAALYVALVGFTTVVATAATTPFALYHFNRIALFAIPANLVAVPLTSFWVMPWAVIAAAAMPFGLDAWPLAAMGWGVEIIIATAERIAGWPGAAWTVPAMPAAGLAACALGGLWLCLWRGGVRWAGVVPVALGLLSIGWNPPADILIDGGARAVAVRGPEGYWLIEGRGADFAVDTWLRRTASDRQEWPQRDGAPQHCSYRLCRLRAGGERIAVVRHRGGLTEACRTSDVVIALVPMRWECGRGVVSIDRRDLARSGAHAIYLGGGRPRVETVAEGRGRRPWTTVDLGILDEEAREAGQ